MKSSTKRRRIIRRLPDSRGAVRPGSAGVPPASGPKARQMAKRAGRPHPSGRAAPRFMTGAWFRLCRVGLLPMGCCRCRPARPCFRGTFQTFPSTTSGRLRPLPLRQGRSTPLERATGTWPAQQAHRDGRSAPAQPGIAVRSLPRVPHPARRPRAQPERIEQVPDLHREPNGRLPAVRTLPVPVAASRPFKPDSTLGGALPCSSSARKPSRS